MSGDMWVSKNDTEQRVSKNDMEQNGMLNLEDWIMWIGFYYKKK